MAQQTLSTQNRSLWQRLKSQAGRAHAPGVCVQPPLPADTHVYMVIRGAESCERRWGNQPGNLPVGVAPAGLVGVGAGASIDPMGLLPSQ